MAADLTPIENSLNAADKEIKQIADEHAKAALKYLSAVVRGLTLSNLQVGSQPHFAPAKQKSKP